ncbi:MAG: hypothetical protein V2A74_09800 [bacterium]
MSRYFRHRIGDPNGPSHYRRIALTLSVLILATLPAAAQPPAFPGAEGFGASATGGRGGRVIYVTNLNTSGPGSLQDALETSGTRYILFKVSGLIPGLVQMRYGEATIAGQTSPGGVYVRGFLADDEPDWDTPPRHDNWILRFVHSRPDSLLHPPTPEDRINDDALRILQSERVIVDHCSFARAEDECVQLSECSSITIQNCLLAETPGDHFEFGGMLVNYTSSAHPLNRLSIHHNMWNRIYGRLPELSRESPAATSSTLDIELSCNAIWDPGVTIYAAADTNVGTDPPMPIFYNLNWVNNTMFARSTFTSAMFTDAIVRNPASAPRNRLYVSGNRHNRWPLWSDYQLFYCCNDFDTLYPSSDPLTALDPILAQQLAQRHPFPAISYTPADQMLDYALTDIGCFPRDPMDRRLMSAVTTRTIDPRSLSDPLQQVNDAFALDFNPANPPPVPTDTDSDGMPDDWESAHGLNPSVEDHNGTQLSSQGYTNLEVYLNELADQRIHPGPVSSGRGVLLY